MSNTARVVHRDNASPPDTCSNWSNVVRDAAGVVEHVVRNRAGYRFVDASTLLACLIVMDGALIVERDETVAGIDAATERRRVSTDAASVIERYGSARVEYAAAVHSVITGDRGAIFHCQSADGRLEEITEVEHAAKVVCRDHGIAAQRYQTGLVV